MGDVGRVADALPGRAAPLGATPRDGGTNFAVASGIADAIELCLFDEAGAERRVQLPRVPVRPGRYPGPPGRRVQPDVRVLRHGGAGPGGVAGQAHRRAVGRRAAGQLRSGAVPGAVARVERPVPGQHAGLLAQPGDRRHRRVRHPVRRLLRPVRRRPPQPERLGQPDHRARRVHGAGPGVLRRQAQRGQRGGQPGRHDDNRSWNCGAEGPTPTRRCWPCGPGSPGPY